MEVFFLSSPIAKYSQGPLIHPVRAFSVSKCSILLYLTLWDQHNMILRGRKVVPSSTEPKSVDAHSLAFNWDGWSIHHCQLSPLSLFWKLPSQGSFSRTSIPSWVSRVYSLKSAHRRTAGSQLPGQGAGTHHIPLAHGEAQGGEGRELGAVSASAASDWTLTKHESTPKAS